MTFYDLQKRREDLEKRSQSTIEEMIALAEESFRVAEVAHSAKMTLEKLDAEFESQTGLNKTDVKFMLFATALQCVRWFLYTKFPDRVDDQTAAKSVKGKPKEKSDRKHRWYQPSLVEIISNPAPFDAMMGSPDFDLGLGGKTHRKTPGHDPILGWVIGTSNIATSTLTHWTLDTYHVKTGEDKLGRKKDKITNHADTKKMFEHTWNKLADEGVEGKMKVGMSVIKEYIHLKSDIGSKESLPFPLISTITASPELAAELAEYGLDTGNLVGVAKQTIYASLINTVIGMIHYLIYDPIKDGARKLYEVRTRKVITYSNLISSSSNVLWVTLNGFLGNANELKRLDIGGFLVAVYHLISDGKFINDLKEEFIVGNFINLIRGN